MDDIWSSSSSSESDDSDIEEMFFDHDAEHLLLLHLVDKCEAGEKKRRRGSTVGRLCIPRNRVLGHKLLMKDYFAEVPTYPAHLSGKRYRMRRSLFVRIVEACEQNCRFFTRRRNVVGLLGFSAYQKILAAMRVITYGIPSDYTDEYLRIGEDTTLKCVRVFANTMIRVFGPEYLRAPNEEDTKKLMAMNEARGWPGMLGSVDCMHRNWKNCLKAWAGQYTGHQCILTIVLEAVASHDLRIWHCFFGLPGSLNDINVLHGSHLFAPSGNAPVVNYTVNGHDYTMGYYLVDGIYPSWATFFKTISKPVGKKQTIFSQAQEACRKDIERAFGVLQARLAIVRGLAPFRDIKSLSNIMTACVILHNMIIEDESDLNLEFFYDNIGSRVKPTRKPDEISAFLETYRQIEDRDKHQQLRNDLIAHQWKLYGK